MKGQPKRRRARIYVLPGVERRDISPAPAARRVLEAAVEAGLSDVVLVGVDRAGVLYVAGSYHDTDRAVGVLMRGVTYISGGRMAGPQGDLVDDVT